MSLCAIEGLQVVLVLVLPDVCLLEDRPTFQTLLSYQHTFIASVLATYALCLIAACAVSVMKPPGLMEQSTDAVYEPSQCLRYQYYRIRYYDSDGAFWMNASATLSISLINLVP